MSEPGWTHLESPEPEADPNSEVESEETGYAVDAVAFDADSSASDSGPEGEDSDDDTEGVGDVETATSRAGALLAGIGKGASSALQGVGRMSPRTRIGVASGLSILALAGAMFTRGAGKSAVPAQIGAAGASTKALEGEAKAKAPDVAKADDPKKDGEKSKGADPGPAKGKKDTLAETTPPPDQPGAGKKNEEPIDPTVEKPPTPGATADPGAVLVANTDAKDNKDGLDLPLPTPTGHEPAASPSTEPPLPTAASSADPELPKSSGDAKIPHPDPEPMAPPAGGSESPPASSPPAANPAVALTPIGDDLDKLPTPPASTTPTPAAAEPPLPGSTPPTDTPKTEPEKKDPGKEIPPLPTPSSTIPVPQPTAPDPAAPPASTPPTVAGMEKPGDLTPPSAGFDGKTAEPKIEPQGSPPITSAPSIPEPAAAPATALGEMPKPQADLTPSPPKELPRNAIEAATGATAVAVGGATAAVAASAIPKHDNPPPSAKPESSPPDPDAIPIRNSRASQPHDLNSADDPRGDESLGLFDSGPNSSAVSPSANPVAADKDRQFETEAPAPKTKGRVAQVETKPRMNRVEVTYHPVEKGENFWTISRLYYGSGRYYKALWAANKQTVPVMDQLRLSQVIVIPAQEDLDASLIEPAHIAAAASAAAKSSRTASSRGDRRDPKLVAARPNRSLKASGIDPIADEDDDNFAARSRASGRAHPRERDIDDGLDRVSDTTTDRDTDLPIHKVRPRETLRSIARDRLGDSRRANEILRLNRGLIDDPSNLIAGQVIELPEDAKPGRR